MSCCPNTFPSKDASFSSLVVNNRAAICQLCANHATINDLRIDGNLFVNNQILVPSNFFTLPLSIPFVIGTLVNGAIFNLGGSPPVIFNTPGDAITMTNIYVPSLSGLIIRIPARDFAGSGTCVLNVNINGVTTLTNLAAVGVTFVDIPLGSATNPITIIITYASGAGLVGCFDPVIYIP